MESPPPIQSDAGTSKKGGCMKGMLFGGCGVLLLLAVTVILLVVLGSRQTKALTSTAEPFFGKVQAGQLQEAYDSTSPAFREELSFEDFQSFVESEQLSGYSSIDFRYASADDADEDALLATVTTKDGKEAELLVMFIETTGGYAVSGLTEAPEEPEPSSTTTVETWAKKEKQTKSVRWSWSTAKLENIRFQTPSLPDSDPPTFPADIARIVVEADLRNAPPDTEITSAFFYLNEETGREMEVARDSVVGQSGGEVYFRFERADAVMAVGDWIVRLLIDGNPKGEVPFRVSLDLEDLTKKADEGDANAQLAVGLALRDQILGYEGPSDDAKSVTYLEMSAEQGNEHAQFFVGEMYMFGRGVEANTKTAIAWLQKSAGQGFPKAQRVLGELYQRGEGVEQDLDQAASWLQKAADQGDLEGLTLLAKLYLNYGDETKKQEGAALIQKAEQAGSGEAQLILGQMHERGIVVEKNLATARQFYEKAVASGLEEANEALRRLDAPTAPKAKE